MSYMPLARRYRPQKFADVIGQSQAIRALKNALLSQKTTHAYLFSGTRGCGKTTLARLLAKAVNCIHLSSEAEPCQECASCLEIAASHSLDVIEIDGASHRGIDDIRQIKESVGFQPSTGKFKVYIIDEVHMLTKEAFNALLKTLEEPPSTVKFILATTEPHKVPATIASRCQKFALRNIEPSLVVEALEKILSEEKVSYETELLWNLGRRSEGSLRDCLSLLDQLLAFEPEKLTLKGLEEILGLAPIERLQTWEEMLQEGKTEKLWSFTAALQDAGIEVRVFIEQLQEHYQALLKASYGIEEGSTETKAVYKKLKNFYQPQDLLFILNKLDESLQTLRFSHHPRLHLEMILLHLMQKPWQCTIDHLVRHLENIKSDLSNGGNKTAGLLPVTEKKTAPVSFENSEKIAENQVKEIIAPAPLVKKTPEATPATAPISTSPKIAISDVKPVKKTEVPQVTPPQTSPPKAVAKAPTSSAASSSSILSTPSSSVPSETTMSSGTFEGLIQFAARELGGHLR